MSEHGHEHDEFGRCMVPLGREWVNDLYAKRLADQKDRILITTPAGDESWLEDMYEQLRVEASINRELRLRWRPAWYSGVDPSYAVGAAIQTARIRHAALPWWRRAYLWLYWRTSWGRNELERRLGELERGTR